MNIRDLSRFSEDELEEFWKRRHISAYEKLESTEGWLPCKVCCVYPRTWIFDNGSHATCLCYEKYAYHPARSESIGSVLERTGSFKEYDRDNLRLAWNKFATTGEENNKLEEGMW